MLAVDTSVIVAGLLEWHEAHEPCREALDQALGSTKGLVVPAPALVEAYSVMTRLPAPHRLRPRDAMAALEQTFRAAATLGVLPAGELWRSLLAWPDHDIAGGRAYDAHIVAVAVHAGAKRILTLNPVDFESIAGDVLEVVVPGA